MTSRHVRYVREFPDNNNHKGTQSTLVACGPLKNGIVNFFILLTFDKHDKVQFLVKFKKALQKAFRAILNF